MARGKTLLLTRPLAQSQALARDIARLNPATTCLLSPLLEITFTGSLPPLDGFGGLVFTSANGVRGYALAGGTPDLPAFCVGARTAAVAQAAGFAVRSADGDVGDLARLLDGAQGPFLHVRGGHVAGNLAARPDVAEVVLYHQTPVPLTAAATQALAQGQVDGVVLYSPRTADVFVRELGRHTDWRRDSVVPLCLSRNIAERLAGAGLAPAQIAAAPRRDDMQALIAAFLG